MLDRLGKAVIALPDTERVALTALFGVLIGAVVSWAVSRRTVYINSVTAERSKWIEKLRKNISSLIGNYRHFIIISPDGRYSDSDVYKSLSKEVGQLSAELILQLNPDGIIDGNLIVLIGKIQGRFRDITFDYHRAERLLIEHSQWLLKDEWEKVKYEASGFFARRIADAKTGGRLARYKSYAQADGSFEELTIKSN